MINKLKTWQIELMKRNHLKLIVCIEHRYFRGIRCRKYKDYCLYPRALPTPYGFEEVDLNDVDNINYKNVNMGYEIKQEMP